MKSLVALTVLLIIGSTQGGLINPYYGVGYGYPGYAAAPYARQYLSPYAAPYVPALKVAEETEEKAEEPKATPFVGGFAAPYAAGFAAPYATGFAAPYAAGYAAPYAAGYAAPYAAGYAAPYAAGYGYPASSQFHSQDEFGNLKFGYSNINSAKQEAGNTYGGVSGGYQYVDANGVLQSVSYVADGLGFRTVDSRLPVAPEVPEVKPLVQAPAPVFEGKQIPDTPEVTAAKAEFQKAYDAAAAATESA